MFTIVNEFVEWLQQELNDRGWSQSDLARNARVAKSSISMIFSREREPGPEVSRAIARALDLPEELVFREAGLLSPKNEEPPTLSEWIHIFWSADESERDRMIEVAKTLLRESKK